MDQFKKYKEAISLSKQYSFKNDPYFIFFDECINNQISLKPIFTNIVN